VECPQIELYAVFSCDCDLTDTISLREEFFPHGERCDIDVTVHVIRFNPEHTDILNQYIRFCRVFNGQLAVYGYSQQTIRETLRICSDEGILTEYIKKMENEIMDIMTKLFNQENVTRLYGNEREKIGINEGRRERDSAIIHNLLQMHMDLPFIEKATGLSREDILKIQAEGGPALA